MSMRIRKKFLLIIFIVIAITGGLWITCKYVAGRMLLPIAKNQIEKYTGSEVKIDKIDVQFNGLAKICGIEVPSYPDKNDRPPKLKVDSITVEFSVLSLLKLEPRLRSLTLEDFSTDLLYNKNLSSWNFAFGTSNKKKGKSTSLPALILKNGSIRLGRISDGNEERIVSVRVKNGALTQTKDGNGFGFNLDINPSASGLVGSIGGKLVTDKSGESGQLIINSQYFTTGPKPIFGNIWNVRKLQLEMDFGDDYLDIKNFEWQMGKSKVSLFGKVSDYKDGGDFQGEITAENLRLSENFVKNTLVYGEGLSENLWRHLRYFFDQFNPEGVCDLQFKVAGKLNNIRKAEWSGTVTSKNATVRHKKFPYELEKITGQIHLSNRTIRFVDLKGSHDDVKFDIHGGAKFVNNHRFTDITVSSDNMLLDKDVYRALGKKKQSIWYTFTPKGRAKIKYHFTRRHELKKNRGTLEVEMLGGEAKYMHFPYHLKNITGHVRITPEAVEITDLQSISDEGTITLNGEITNLRNSRPRYNCRIIANDIPLDSRLKSAIPHNQRDFYDSFKMKARTDAVIDIFPNQVDTRPVEYIARIKIEDALMEYEKFPLPLKNVNVDAVLTPSLTKIEKLTGENGDGKVEVTGKFWPPNKEHSKTGYYLNLKAKNIRLQDKWLKALPKNNYKIVSQLQPEGAINVNADLGFLPRGNYPDNKIVVENLGSSINYKKFPYPVKNITGKVIIEKDLITFKDIKSVGRAKPDPEGVTKSLSIDGTISTEKQKIQNCKLSISADNYAFDDKLVNAIEMYSKNFKKRFDSSGRFDLDIAELNYYNDDKRKNILDFKSKLTLKDFTLKNQKTLGALDGNVKFSGVYQIGRGLLQGISDFNGEKVVIKDRLFENVQGKLEYFPQTNSFYCREYTADCYDGSILGSLALSLKDDDNVDYSVETVFSEVDLHNLVHPKENAKKQDYTKGKLSGYFGITGKLGDTDSRFGRLKLEASGMEFAEQTTLGKILSATQLKKPTEYIFSDISAESFLRNNTLFVDEVLIFGKSTQMKGSGSIDLSNGEMSMSFHSFGKKTSKPSFIEILARGMGPAVVEVDVGGTFDEPKINTTVLPVIRKPFEIFGTKE